MGWDAWLLLERFTKAARTTITEARGESRELRHRYVGVEHLLLGLLREGESVAAQVLRSRGVTLERFRARLLEVVGAGEHDLPEEVHAPFTPRAKKVLELAFRGALAFGADSVGPEHLLLGIADENVSVAMRIMREEWGLNSEVIRSAVVDSMPARPPGRIPSRGGGAAAGGVRKERWIGVRSVNYDEALEAVLGWEGRTVVVLSSFDMPGIGFEDREFRGSLREGLVPRESSARVLTARARVNGELQPTSEDGRHFSVWSVDASAAAQGRPLLQFALFRDTFTESAWLEANDPESRLMIRHGSFRWVIGPQR
jgi:ATP-dependent Clp protease ATP-binding subunit ClpC